MCTYKALFNLASSVSEIWESLLCKSLISHGDPFEN